MFKNKKNTNKKNTYMGKITKKCIISEQRICFLYIFNHFAYTFLACFFIFFAILTSFRQIDNDSGSGFVQNLFFSSIYSLNMLINNINIVTIVSCIFFFIKTAKNFNIYVLESFGLTSSVILRPIFTFLIIISLFKTFCLNPLYVQLENYKKDKTKKIKQENLVKDKTKFTIIDDTNGNNYMIITGTYNRHTNNFFSFTKAKFFQIKNKKLTTCYYANEAILSENKFLLSDVSIANIQNNNTLQSKRSIVNLHSNQTVDKVIAKITTTGKLEKEITLDVYDCIKLLLKNISSIKNEAEIYAISCLFSNFLSLLNAILCCLLSFLFCVQSSREANMLKFSLKCFIVCFTILRVFDFLMKIAILSMYTIFCIASATFLLCCFVYLLILDRDWCNFYRRDFFLKIIRFSVYCRYKCLKFIALISQKYKRTYLAN